MTKVILPPQPYNCRRPPPPPVSTSEPFEDELGKRVLLHSFMDEEFKGVIVPPDLTPVRPSFRMYTTNYRAPSRSAGARDTNIEVWRLRWYYARTLDVQHLRMSVLLQAIGVPLLCRRPGQKRIRFFPFEIGHAVHARISEVYRSQFPNDTVACDGRVYFRDGTDEKLSQLALNDPRSVYGGLNYCLAGQRCDIINIDGGEIWEIKPASLSSANLLQLWGYLDNYEVARVLAHYRSQPPLPRLEAGDPMALPKKVIEPFDLEITEDVTLGIVPFVVPALPGQIIYEVVVRRRRRPQRARARQVMAVTSLDIQQVLVTAKRNVQYMLEVKDAETRRLLIVCGMLALLLAAAAAGVLIAGAVGAVGSAAVEVGIAGTQAAVVAPLPAAQLAAVEAEVIAISSAAPPAVTGVSLPAIAELAPRVAASLAVVYVGNQQLRVPPETVGLCISAGCEIGEASVPELPDIH